VVIVVLLVSPARTRGLPRTLRSPRPAEPDLSGCGRGSQRGL